MNNKIENKEGFEKLKTNISPPENLEEKVMMKLKSMNLLSRSERKKSYVFKISYSLALLFVGLAIGYSINFDRKPTSATAKNKSQYILLLYQNEELKGNEKERIHVYGSWAYKYGAKKIVVGGERLEESGRIISLSGEEISVTEIKSIYDPRITSGYFIIETESYDEAVNIALTCPHIKYGGYIEIREITDFSKL